MDAHASELFWTTYLSINRNAVKDLQKFSSLESLSIECKSIGKYQNAIDLVANFCDHSSVNLLCDSGLSIKYDVKNRSLFCDSMGILALKNMILSIPNLNSLKLSNMDGKPDAYLKIVEDCTALTELYLDEEVIDTHFISKFPHLRVLHVAQVEVSPGDTSIGSLSLSSVETSHWGYTDGKLSVGNYSEAVRLLVLSHLQFPVKELQLHDVLPGVVAEALAQKHPITELRMNAEDALENAERIASCAVLEKLFISCADRQQALSLLQRTASGPACKTLTVLEMETYVTENDEPVVAIAAMCAPVPKFAQLSRFSLDDSEEADYDEELALLQLLLTLPLLVDVRLPDVMFEFATVTVTSAGSLAVIQAMKRAWWKRLEITFETEDLDGVIRFLETQTVPFELHSELQLDPEPMARMRLAIRSAAFGEDYSMSAVALRQIMANWAHVDLIETRIFAVCRESRCVVLYIDNFSCMPKYTQKRAIAQVRALIGALRECMPIYVLKLQCSGKDKLDVATIGAVLPLLPRLTTLRMSCDNPSAAMMKALKSGAPKCLRTLYISFYNCQNPQMFSDLINALPSLRVVELASLFCDDIREAVEQCRRPRLKLITKAGWR